MGKKAKTEVGNEIGEIVQKNPTQTLGFFLTPFPTSPHFATVMSTKNHRQFSKKLGQAKSECYRSA